MRLEVRKTLAGKCYKQYCSLLCTSTTVMTNTPCLSSIEVDPTGVPKETQTSKNELEEDTEQRPECNRLDMIRDYRADRRLYVCCQSTRMD